MARRPDPGGALAATSALAPCLPAPDVRIALDPALHHPWWGSFFLFRRYPVGCLVYLTDAVKR
jgi:hypothetical protein